MSRPISCLISALRELALVLGHKIEDERRLAHLVAAAEQRAADDEDALHVGTRCDAARDLFGDGLRIGEARARRQLDAEQRAATVLGRQEAVRKEVEAADGADENQDAEGDALDAVAHGPAHQPRIGAQDRTFMIHRVVSPHEIGRQQRRDQTRDQQREEHGRRDDEAELLEVLPGDAAHERHRREHGDDGRGDGDDGEADLVGGFQRGAIGRFAHAHVAHDVLDLDDGVVDEDAGDDGDGEQAHEVEREAHGLHGPEGRDDRQRQRDGGDDGRAPVAQEDEHDDDGQHGAFDQRLHRRLIDAERILDRVVDVGELYVGIELRDLRHLGGDGLGDSGVARALRARNGEGDDRLAVELGERARLGDAVGRRSQADRAAPCGRRARRSWSRPDPRLCACRRACGSPARGPRFRRGRLQGRRSSRGPGG